jgi:hypothetical protein
MSEKIYGDRRENVFSKININMEKLKNKPIYKDDSFSSADISTKKTKNAYYS